MKLLNAILAGLTLMGIPQSLWATGCHAPYVSYATPTYVQREVVVVKQIPVYVAAFVPVVSVGYAAPGVAVAPAAPAVQAPMPASAPAPCDALAARVAQLERLLQAQGPPAGAQPGQGANVNGTNVQPPAQALPQPQPGAAPQGQVSTPPPGAAYAAVFTQRCAECHTEGSLKKNGFPLVNAAGAPLAFNHEQVARILAYTKGKVGKPPVCPKGKSPLDDREFGALLELLDN